MEIGLSFGGIVYVVQEGLALDLPLSRITLTISSVCRHPFFSEAFPMRRDLGSVCHFHGPEGPHPAVAEPERFRGIHRSTHDPPPQARMRRMSHTVPRSIPCRGCPIFMPIEVDNDLFADLGRQAGFSRY
jgi:hypothetical protein